MPLISVIIPTRERDVCLRQTLQDLALQEFRDFDVWVIDQNPAPLEGLQREAGELTLHHEHMPPMGSHAGRNHAIFKTAAEICVFVDDDVRFEQSFIGDHARAYGPDRALDCIAGRVVQPRDGYTKEQMRHIGRTARYNPWMGLVHGNFVGMERAKVQHIHECNFSARTAALRTVGGFNEEFQGNAYFEGADLALRLIEAGYCIEYRPEIVLTHLQEGAGGNRVVDKARHTYWFMRNYGLLNSLHMHAVGLPVFSSYGMAYVVGKAVKNRDIKIAVQGVRGLVAGLRYFVPGARRLRINVQPIFPDKPG